jgi:predicted O-methyltransferase YrrM
LGNLKSINPQYSKASRQIYKTGQFAEARECKKAALERKPAQAAIWWFRACRLVEGSHILMSFRKRQTRMLPMSKNKALRQFFALCQTVNLLQIKLCLKGSVGAKSFPGHIFRKYMMLAKRDRWNSAAIEELVPPSSSLQATYLHVQSPGLGASANELVCMGLLARSLDATAIFEIGTYHGRTALNFAANSPEDAVVYTLDLPPEEREAMMRRANPNDAHLIQVCKLGEHFESSPFRHKIRQLFGNSLSFDFTQFYGKMDLVFIDACHHYDAVISDTTNALKMVRPGGVVMWHEFANIGDYHDVTRAVLELLPARDIYQIEDTQLAVYRMPGARSPERLHSVMAGNGTK